MPPDERLSADAVPTYLATLEFRIQASTAQEAVTKLEEMTTRYIFGWPCQVGLATRLIDGGGADG